MGKGPGEVLHEIRNVFDNFKNFLSFDIADVQLQQHDFIPNDGAEAFRKGANSFFKDMSNVCVRVCAFDELTGHLAGMRATLFHLHRSLATLELCLLVEILTATVSICLLGGLVLATWWVCARLRASNKPGINLRPKLPGLKRKRLPSQALSLESNEYADYISPEEGEKVACQDPPIWSTVNIHPQDLRLPSHHEMPKAPEGSDA